MAMILDGNITIIEARAGGVTTSADIEYQSWAEHKEIQVWLPIFDYDKDMMSTNLAAEIGKGYDFRSLFKHLSWAIRKFFAKFSGKGEKYTGDEGTDAMRKWYCSELAAYCWNRVHPSAFWDWHSITPTQMNNDSRAFFTNIYAGAAVNWKYEK